MSKTDKWITMEHNNTFIEWFQHRVSMQMSSGEKVSNNFKWLHRGSKFQAMSYSEFTIKNCTFNATNSAVNAPEKTAILIQKVASGTVEISGNTISNSEHNGIQVTKVAGTLRVMNNTISNTGSRAIRISTVAGSTIRVTDNITSNANTNAAEATENGNSVIKISGAGSIVNLSGNTYGGAAVTFVAGDGTYSAN